MGGGQWRGCKYWVNNNTYIALQTARGCWRQNLGEHMGRHLGAGLGESCIWKGTKKIENK